MKDIIQKLTELEATAPKTSKKKMLKEDSTTPPMNAETKPSRLKDIFETMVSGQPIPVVGKVGDTAQTGAGFLNMTDTSPAAQALGKAVGDLVGQKKLQIVVPAPTGTAKPGQPAPAGATGQPQAGQMQMKEKDEGKPGKNFAKIAKSAAERYGSKAAGERVAGAVRAKLMKQGKLEEESMDESGLQAYLGNKKYGKEGMDALRKAGREGASKEKMAKIRAKYDKLDEEQLDEKFASQQQAKLMYATAGGADTGVSKKVAKEFIKKSHGQKVGKLPNKKTDEADIPSTNGIDTMGAGLGAGRSQTTLEAKEPQVEVIDNAFNRENYKDLIGKKYPKSKAPAYARVKEISEGAKPDFLDLDKDGNKKESMKKAAADKKKQKVKESMNHRISAARLEGKSHGLRGHAHSGKRYEDLEEMKAYHEGYKEGLDECYGMGIYEGVLGTLGGAALGGMLGGPVGAAIGAVGGQEMTKGGSAVFDETAPATPPATVSGMANAAMEADMDEGNTFTGALAKTPKGGKFSVGGKTFTDTSNLEEYAFESWDRELSNLLNEGEEVTEGLSVSVSKGNPNSPDSVNVNATDAEAEHLLALVKNAGLGLFADEEPAQSMSVQPDHGEPHEIGTGGVDIDVVDGDDMLSLIKKMGGVEAAGAQDYADEEGHKDCGCSGDCDCNEKTDEDMCNECGTYEGMHEAGCSMGKGKEMVDEVESEDQMEFEVAEDNAPDSEEAEHTADEDAEAQEDAALAKAAQQDKTTTVNEGGDGGEASEEGPESKEGETDEEGETVSESFINLFKKLAFIAEESEAEKDDKAEKAGKKVAKDIEYDEGHKGKDDDKAEKAGKKVTKDIEYDDKKDAKEKVDEWANNAGPGKTVSDTTFEQDIDFMTKVIAGGLNKPKSTGQTTIPVIAGQEDRMHDNPQDWATLAGIKK